MNCSELESMLKLQNKFLSIKRINRLNVDSYAQKGCTLTLLKDALSGETLYFSKENVTCPGAATGLGFTDGIPNVPGGFKYFISHGRGEGFPPGERVKCSPEIGEAMILAQPQNVMKDFDCIRIKPYAEDDEADTVTALVTMDQLSTLIHLFCFRHPHYDNVIAPMVSGCASIFRVPFGEMERECPRAVIGNVDVFSRTHFEKNTAFFTVSAKDFKKMLDDADTSVLASPIWKSVQARL